MDDELKMDASGCWIRKNAQVISEAPLRSHSVHYNSLVGVSNPKDNVDNDEQEKFLSSGKE